MKTCFFRAFISIFQFNVPFSSRKFHYHPKVHQNSWSHSIQNRITFNKFFKQLIFQQHVDQNNNSNNIVKLKLQKFQGVYRVH